MKKFSRFLLFAAAMTGAVGVHAQGYKCTEGGKTIYQQHPCRGGGRQPPATPEPEKTAAQIQAEFNATLGVDEMPEPPPRKRLLIAADPSAPYFILERDGGENRYRGATVKRAGKEKITYARLAFDCQRYTVRVLGEGMTYHEMKKSNPSTGPVVIEERSVHDYIGSDICRGYVVDPMVTAAENRAQEDAKYAYTRREVVTLSDYQSVYTGMNYREVEKTLGRPGREVSRSYLPGIPGATLGISTVMYEWVNRDGSNMNAMFQDGRLVQKAQFGLQ